MIKTSNRERRRKSTAWLISRLIFFLNLSALVSSGHSQECEYDLISVIYNIGTSPTSRLGVEIPANGTYLGGGSFTSIGLPPGGVNIQDYGYYDTAWSDGGNEAFAVYTPYPANSPIYTNPPTPLSIGGCPALPGQHLVLTTTRYFFVAPGGVAVDDNSDDGSGGSGSGNDGSNGEGGGNGSSNTNCFTCVVCAGADADTSDDDPGGDEADDAMTVWNVTQPYISLHLHDRPLTYQPAAGPRISLKLAYKQRTYVDGPNPNFFSMGRKWIFSWSSSVYQDAYTNNVVQFPTGRIRTFFGGVDYLTNTKLTGDTTNGFTLLFSDGSQIIYGYIVTNSSGAFHRAFMTANVNTRGQKTTFNYANQPGDFPVVRLQTVVDGDGHTNSLSYTTNAIGTNLISQIADPFGRTVSLAYDTNGLLTNITDVIGITSAFTYDTNGLPTSLTTPYGTTSFRITDTASGTVAPDGRSILVTQADGGHHLFLYTNSAAGIATSYTTNQVPVTSPFTNTLDTNNLDVRNSFHWGPRQYANLSTTNIYSFTTNDFRLARMKHWLILTNSSGVGNTISMVRAPSPDAGGFMEGQKTWYDYAGKTNRAYEGTQVLPLLVAIVLPDGTTSFSRSVRSSIGNVLNNVSTYSSNNTVALRTNIFTYDSTNGIDLLTITNAMGTLVSSNAYDTNHEVVTNYDALSEMTVFAYNTNKQIIGVTFPNGLVISNQYGADGYISQQVLVGFSTNSFTYTNALLLTHTDPRGLTTTNTWDSLNRLTSVVFPDGTYISNAYSTLDLGAQKDRLGNWTQFQYDNMRRLRFRTNALTNVTVYSYCTCGALESVQDALSNTAYLYYNNAGWLTNAVYPAEYSVTNNYDALGRLTNRIDSFGASVTNWFNNQGLRFAVSNYFGQANFATFDILDHITTNTGANDVSVVATYDTLNRILTRTYPPTGTQPSVEHFVYNTNGLIAYTNQLTNVTLYGYDGMGRIIGETNANNETNGFTYDAAGDLLTLTDGKGQTSTWHYDQFGRVTNKVDAATNTVLIYKYDAVNRLTNRYSISKGNTYYSFDAVGNPTNVSYSDTNHSISLTYDADNHLTNIVDGIGTTRYTYDGSGQLLAEGGLWPNDTVSYSYNNRLRSGLSVAQPNADFWTQTYGYDNARRLTNTTSPAGAFGYAYDGTRNLRVSALALPNGASITNAYDSNARLLATVLINSGNSILNSHSYTYNVGNQRTQQTFTAGNYDNYTYDNIGQLATAFGKESVGTDRLLEQLSYVYDAAHNLNYRTNNALTEDFGVNNLNELSTTSHSGTLTVEGTSGATANSVSVNGNPAALYSDNTFAEAGFTVTNGNNSFTAIASDSLGRHSTNSVSVYFAGTNSTSYDLNGNLLYDGLRTFAYDDENQLTSVLVSNAWQSQFIYDGKMRRRIRKEFTWQDGAWIQTNEVRYIYDGTAVLQERDINNLPIASFTGVGGGLLAMSQPSTVNPDHLYYHADGNGNITALVNEQQIVVAKYLYDPFGNTLSMSGPMASANRYRFSSKEYNDNSGIYYFGRRFYDPNLQRWLNRDPILESGGNNLFGYVANSPINKTDPVGLLDYFYSSGSLFYPQGPVPYLEADTTLGELGAGAYNTIPFLYNSFFGGLSNIGTGPGTVSGQGGGALAMTGAILQDAVNSIPALAPAALEYRAQCQAEKAVQAMIADAEAAFAEDAQAPSADDALAVWENEGGAQGPPTYSLWDTSGGLKGINTDVTADDFLANLQANGYTARTTFGANGSVTILENGQGATYTIYIRTSTGQSGAQYIGPSGQFLKYNLGQ
jgi:RHS repeat-associated protein